MGIKPLNQERTKWAVRATRRHPVLKKPKGLTRTFKGTEKQARKFQIDLEIELDRKISESLKTRWSEVLEKCLFHMRYKLKCTEKTVANYRYYLEAYTLPVWADRAIDSIFMQEIDDLIEKSAEGKSETQKQSLHKMVKAVFKFARECGLILHDPMPGLAQRKYEKRLQVLTESQAITLLDKALEYRSEWHPLWFTALYTGMRNGELYALTWDKVNFETGMIYVDTSWNSFDGFKSTKSGEARTVPMAPELQSFLKVQKAKLGSTNFVLPRLSKWDKGEQARELRKFLILCKLPDVRFHDLRATWATLMLSKGVPPVKVMQMGGWKELKTMMIYTRAAGIDLKGATDTLGLHDPVAKRGQVVSFDRSKTGTAEDHVARS